jgi:uncharacterized protein involved in type VI secretion and phage assembly
MAEGNDNGIIIGIVDDLEDPDQLGRVRVTYPVHNDEKSDWARMVTPMAGPDRGLRFPYEKGDEVLVGFEHGNPRRPYIFGGLWSGADKPPADDGNTKQSNWRFIKSRSGHVVRLDDTEGKEKIEVIANDGKRKIVIDTSGEKIQIICDTGDVEVSAKKGTVKVEAETVEVKATKDMNLEAGGTMTIKGATVNIN